MIGSVSSGSSMYSLRYSNQQSAVNRLNQTQAAAAKQAEKISSGKKINSAADGAAALAILEKMTAQARGYDVGSANIQDMSSLLKTADGALSSVGDQVSQLRELTLQAANGTLTESDRQSIQMEIEQIQESIGQTASFTEFNTQSLLDGSFANKHVAADASGSGMSISIGSASLDALGLGKLDVTSGYDSAMAALDRISSASGQISSMRGDLGATMNRLDSAYAGNQTAAEAVLGSISQLGDADMAQAASSYGQAMLMQQIGAYVLQQNMHMAGSGTLNLLA